MNDRADTCTLDAIASLDSEHNLIGGLLLDNSGFDHITDLKPDHFFSEWNRDIFAEVSRQIVAGQHCDVVTVSTSMQGRVDMQDINSLAQFVPSKANLRRYADTIIERHQSRALLAMSAEIAELAQDHTRSISERVELAQGQLGKLTEGGPRRDDWQESSDGMVVFIDEIQRRADGEVNFIPTGLTALDEQLDVRLLAASVASAAKTTSWLSVWLAASCNCKSAPTWCASVMLGSWTSWR